MGSMMPGSRQERSAATPGAPAAVMADEATGAQSAGRRSLGELLRGNLSQLPVFVGLVIIAIIFQVASKGFFLQSQNLFNLADQVVSITVLAAAAVLVLLIGEIDLSLAAVAYFTGAVTGVLSVRHGWPSAQAILAGIAVGVVIGLINGTCVAVLRMPSFVVTLAGLIFYQGALSHILQPQTTLQIIDPTIIGIEDYRLPSPSDIAVPAVALAIYAALLLRGRAQRRRAGLPVQSTAQLAIQLGMPIVATVLTVYTLDSYLGVPLTTVIAVAVIVAIWLITAKTAFGRHIYAVGGNAEAARRAGIKIVGVRIAMFTMASTLAAVAGLLIITRGASAPALVDPYLLLNGIAAAVIGGISLFGGRGSVWGVVLGSLIVGSLLNGLALLNVGPDVVEMTEGLVLLGAVLIDALARRASVTGYR
jgi:D-xylose transport system permease protein